MIHRSLLIFALLLLAEHAAIAQNLRGEAWVGEPFGVGRLEVELPAELLPPQLGADGLVLTDSEGRVFYPVVDTSSVAAAAKEIVENVPILRKRPIGQEVRKIIGQVLDRPPRATIYFLFRGQAPLKLSLLARDRIDVPLAVGDSPAAARRLFDAWWEKYTAAPRFLEKKPDYPPLVQNFLKATLARRLGLQLPPREQTLSPAEMLRKEIGLAAAAESVRMAMQQDRLLGLNNLSLPADQPLPEIPRLPPLEYPPLAEEPEIERLALRTPIECFYVRFGSFSNFIWMQDTLARFHGDLQNLVATRGIDYAIKRRIEDQVGLQSSALARLFGDAVIGDVAIIGTDTFFQDGASFGLLFLAKNNFALSADFTRQRGERLKLDGVSEQRVPIDGRTVSYLSSKDGRLRSYYVSDGDYHFVTTSRTLARRFLETADGKTALGTSPAFRHARAHMPLKRNDTVFVFLSDEFFENLASPAYRIELLRRVQATVDIQSVELAVLAAAAEGKPAGSIDALVSGGLLPPDFGPQPDGSRVILENGHVHDSTRGWLGGFVPIADVPTNSASASEAREYRRFADYYRTQWGRMDPTIVAVARKPVKDNLEEVKIEMQLSPFAAEHFRILSQWAGAPTENRVSLVPGDIARLELAMPDQYAFLGFRDVQLPAQQASQSVLTAGLLRAILVGYLGTTGQGGLLGFLDRPLLLPERAGGDRVRLGVARAQAGEFNLYSLQPEVLAEVAPQLHFEQAPFPAQLRLWVGDLSTARVGGFVNSFTYGRTVDTTLGNLRLLTALETQLHVPPEDCLTAANYVLGGRLVCPLGGEYVLSDKTNGVRRWTSTALTGSARHSPLATPPEHYAAPIISWMRELALDATMTEPLLVAHAKVLMELPEMPKPTAESGQPPSGQ